MTARILAFGYSAFDGEQTKAMGLAFDRVCADLKISPQVVASPRHSRSNTYVAGSLRTSGEADVSPVGEKRDGEPDGGPST